MILIPELYFDEEAHIYYVNDRPIPNVTRILEEEGITNFHMVPQEHLAFACYRGHQVHRATMFLDKGILNWASVDELDRICAERYGRELNLRGYIQAWEALKATVGMEIIAIEDDLRCYSKKFMYACTSDRLCTFKNIPSYRGKRVLLDIKSGIHDRAAALQTAANMAAVNEWLPKKEQAKLRAVAYLKPDGTYELELERNYQTGEKPYFTGNDLGIFLAALSLNNWKVMYGFARNRSRNS